MIGHAIGKKQGKALETEAVRTSKDRRKNPSVCREQRSTSSVAKPLGSTQGRKEPRLIQWLLSCTFLSLTTRVVTIGKTKLIMIIYPLLLVYHYLFMCNILHITCHHNYSGG